MADFLNIPIDIRQVYIPFSIEGPGKLQVYSFRPDRKGQAFAQIYPFPKTFPQLFYGDSGMQYSHGPKGSEMVKYDEFLEQIPSIQIREFVPDARLTQTFKWFSYFKQGFDAASKNVDFQLFKGGGIKAALTEAMKNMSNNMRDLTSGSAPLLQKIASGMMGYYRDRGFSFGADAGYAVIWIPFLLYYRLTTTKTNTIYELPYNMQNPVMKSDGTYGWTSSQNFSLLNMAGGDTSAFGKLFSMGFGSTLQVNLMPHFDPSQGSVNGSVITITIDLINDSDIAACNNFLLCHTLFGNNRWLQYGFVQASASLYDIKLPGANRYFMCSGQFTCTGKGSFRTPSDTVIEYIFSHANKNQTFAKAVEKVFGGDKADGILQQAAEDQANDQLRRIGAVIYDNNPLLGIKKRDRSSDEPSNQFIFIASGQTQTNVNSIGTKIHQTSTTYTVKPDFSNSLVEASSAYDSIKTFDARIKTNENKISINDSRLDTINADLAPLNKAKFAVKDANRNLQDAKEFYEHATPDQFDIAVDRLNSAQAQYNNAQAKYQSLGGQDALDNLNSEKDALTKENNQLHATVEDDKKWKESLEGNYNDIITSERNKLANSARNSFSTHISNSKDIRDLIKIPDVYHLELTFNSLIPDNFNTYLYGFREANLDMFKDYAFGGVNETGVFEQLAQKLAEVMGEDNQLW